MLPASFISLCGRKRGGESHSRAEGERGEPGRGIGAERCRSRRDYLGLVYEKLRERVEDLDVASDANPDMTSGSNHA